MLLHNAESTSCLCEMDGGCDWMSSSVLNDIHRCRYPTVDTQITRFSPDSNIVSIISDAVYEKLHLSPSASSSSSSSSSFIPSCTLCPSYLCPDVLLLNVRDHSTAQLHWSIREILRRRLHSYTSILTLWIIFSVWGVFQKVLQVPTCYPHSSQRIMTR